MLLSVGLSSTLLTAWGGASPLVELPRVVAGAQASQTLPAQARPETPPGQAKKDGREEPPGQAKKDESDKSPGKGPKPKDPPSKVTAPKLEEEMGGVVSVSKYTDASLSKQLGIPLAFLYLAGNACDLQLKCTPGLKDQLKGPAQEWSDQCRINLAQTWCAKGRCKADALDPNGAQWVECYKSIYSRDCAQVSGPVACKVLGDKALTLTPTDWKE